MSSKQIVTELKGLIRFIHIHFTEVLYSTGSLVLTLLMHAFENFEDVSVRGQGQGRSKCLRDTRGQVHVLENSITATAV